MARATKIHSGLWRELGELMTKDCTVIRYNKNLQQTDAKLVELIERFGNVNLSDRSMWANTSFVFTRQLYNMLQLSRVIAQGARMRDESRGAHYKPDFPERDDKNWLKTTKAYFAPDADEPKFEFEPVDVSLIPPRGGQRSIDLNTARALHSDPNTLTFQELRELLPPRLHPLKTLLLGVPLLKLLWRLIVASSRFVSLRTLPCTKPVNHKGLQSFTEQKTT